MIGNEAPRFGEPAANDGGGASEDVRDQLRKDHDQALAELDALRAEKDERQCHARLRSLRQLWMVHALAEETVVYRALEGTPMASEHADERFIEHEVVGGLFDKLAQARPGSLEWNARLKVVREIMAHHMQTEHDDLFADLVQRFDSSQLCELGRGFASAREKLALLEQAKAA